jgi:hypothetical protein
MKILLDENIVKKLFDGRITSLYPDILELILKPIEKKMIILNE